MSNTLCIKTKYFFKPKIVFTIINYTQNNYIHLNFKLI